MPGLHGNMIAKYQPHPDILAQLFVFGILKVDHPKEFWHAKS